MLRREKKTNRDIATYAHAGKECTNNPGVRLATPETDRDSFTKIYPYDSHLTRNCCGRRW